jgi:hypothetical protein
MKGVFFENILLDDEFFEVRITVDDGCSRFRNSVYVSYDELKKLIKDLSVFKDQVYGGLYDLKLGEFGQEYANGAFSARLHFCISKHGKLFISIRMQSYFFDFGIKTVSNEVTLHVISEPVLLDSFVSQFKNLTTEIGNTALLECI